MHIRILRSCACEGKSVAVGEVVPVSDKTARLLTAMGKAEIAEAPTPPKPHVSEPTRHRGRSRANRS